MAECKDQYIPDGQNYFACRFRLGQECDARNPTKCPDNPVNRQIDIDCAKAMAEMSERKRRTPSHPEDDEQAALFQWAAYHKHLYPGIELMHHIPNGGKRNIREATRLKRQGVLAGVPDIFLPVARQGYHGLYIELKAEDGKLRNSQKWFLDEAAKQGYKAEICYGAEQAIHVIDAYMRDPVDTPNLGRIAGEIAGDLARRGR